MEEVEKMGAEKERIQLYNLGEPTESIVVKPYTFTYKVKNKFKYLNWEKRGKYYVLDSESLFNLISQSEILDTTIAEHIDIHLHTDWFKYVDLLGYDRERNILCHRYNPCSCLQITVRTDDPSRDPIKLYIDITHIMFDDVKSCVIGDYYTPIELWTRRELDRLKMGSGGVYFSIIERRFIKPESIERGEDGVYLKYKLSPGKYIHLLWDYFEPTYRIIARVVSVEYNLSVNQFDERVIMKAEWRVTDKHDSANIILSDFFRAVKLAVKSRVFSLDFNKVYLDEDVDSLLGVIEDLRS
ncbi:MAG: hypothetical protein ACP5HH_07300 [Fervidicoccaceae archaeon]